MSTVRDVTLGSVLKRARERKGISQEEVAVSTGLGRRKIQRLEEGDPTVQLEPNQIALIADLLEIEPTTVDQLTEDLLSRGLVNTRIYFRAKHGFVLTKEQCREIEAVAAKLHQESTWEKEDAAPRRG